MLESASPAELAADHFTGYGGVGEYSNSNGNTFEVMQAGHSIRYGPTIPFPKT
jgi:spermidine dehydrogenase